METRITDAQWDRIKEKLGRQGRMGRPRTDDRRCFEAILHVLVSGCRWNDLPKEYGHYSTAWRRLKAWMQDGSFLKIWRYLLCILDESGQIDWSRCAIDGSYVKAKKGATKSGAAGAQ